MRRSAPPVPKIQRSGSDAQSATRDRRSVTLELITLTPIYGGGVAARSIDEIDMIRIPSIRGALRLFWRALFGGGLSSRELYIRERELWGGLGLGAGDGARRSSVCLRLVVTEPSDIDASEPSMRTHDAYALWPAQSPKRTLDGKAAPRRMPGVRFSLTVSYPAVEQTEREVLATLKAWVLFGGIGGRTRRGCGALGFQSNGKKLRIPERGGPWLPADAKELSKLFGNERPLSEARTFPILNGSRFVMGGAKREAPEAWHESLKWLREFRQGCSPNQIDATPAGAFARQRTVAIRPGGSDTKADHPGRSRWVEADKVRHFFAGKYSHPPLPGHGESPAWPRAEFGLPIEIRFKRQDRHRQPCDEPPDVQLNWRVAGEKAARSRLASPLIVKPMQLANGGFAALALWLRRALPAKAEVGIVVKRAAQDAPSLDPKSIAPMGRITGPDDAVLFQPLIGKPDIRTAFMDWVQQKPSAQGGKL